VFAFGKAVLCFNNLTFSFKYVLILYYIRCSMPSYSFNVIIICDLQFIPLQEYRLEVGSIAMPVLNACLLEKGSADLVGVALDTLCCVIGETDESAVDGEHDELGERFAEIFMKNVEQVCFCVFVCFERRVAFIFIV
jgi:hypothetical protein